VSLAVAAGVDPRPQLADLLCRTKYMTGSWTVSLICKGSRANLPRLGATTHGDGQNWMSRPPLSFQVLATLTLPS
jgi:hypothetical protein